MHTDVGGGYAEQQLSDIPLVWLTNQAVAKRLRIYAGHDVDINEDADGFMHDSHGKAGCGCIANESECGIQETW
jgi:hypothetical protein